MLLLSLLRCQDAGSSAVRHANWQTNQLRFSAAGLHYARPLPRPRPRSPRPPLPLSPRPRDRPAPRTAPRPRPRPPPPCCFRAASTSVSSTFSTTSSGTRKYLIVLPLMYTSGSRKNWSPSCGQTGTHSAQRRLSEIQTHGAGWRVRFTRTRDVQMTSRKFRFIQLSHFSRLPLYVSPLFSSTSCGRAAVRGQGRGARHARGQQRAQPPGGSLRRAAVPSGGPSPHAAVTAAASRLASLRRTRHRHQSSRKRPSGAPLRPARTPAATRNSSAKQNKPSHTIATRSATARSERPRLKGTRKSTMRARTTTATATTNKATDKDGNSRLICRERDDGAAANGRPARQQRQTNHGAHPNPSSQCPIPNGEHRSDS